MAQWQHVAVDGSDPLKLGLWSLCVESGVAVEVAHQFFEPAGLALKTRTQLFTFSALLFLFQRLLDLLVGLQLAVAQTGEVLHRPLDFQRGQLMRHCFLDFSLGVDFSIAVPVIVVYCVVLLPPQHSDLFLAL